MESGEHSPPTQSTAPADSQMNGADHTRRVRALQLLGLAVRARKVAIGADAVMSSIQSTKAGFVLVSADAGLNMAKKYRDKCAFYHIPHAVLFTRYEIGAACGKSHTVAVAFIDPGFAAKMRELVGEINGGEAFGETSSL